MRGDPQFYKEMLSRWPNKRHDPALIQLPRVKQRFTDAIRVLQCFATFA